MDSPDQKHVLPKGFEYVPPAKPKQNYTIMDSPDQKHVLPKGFEYVPPAKPKQPSKQSMFSISDETFLELAEIFNVWTIFAILMIFNCLVISVYLFMEVTSGINPMLTNFASLVLLTVTGSCVGWLFYVKKRFDKMY